MLKITDGAFSGKTFRPPVLNLFQHLKIFGGSLPPTPVFTRVNLSGGLRGTRPKLRPKLRLDARKSPHQENTMLAGINQNITHNGELYHIQTEDGGRKNPVINTVLFKEGVVVTTRKTPYSDILKSDKCELVVKEIMNEQHGAVVRELKQGRFEIKRVFPEGGKEAGETPPLSEGKNKAGASPPDKKETADTQPLPPSQPPSPAAKKSIDDIILEQLSITEK